MGNVRESRLILEEVAGDARFVCHSTSGVVAKFNSLCSIMSSNLFIENM